MTTALTSFFRDLGATFWRPAGRPTSRRKAVRARLRVEPLEGRWVPASQGVASLFHYLPASPFTAQPEHFDATTTYQPYSGSEYTWGSAVQPLENSVFRALMSYRPEDHATAYDLRIGQGGQSYSLIGEFGEAIPPQVRPGPRGKEFSSPWIDGLFMTVAQQSVGKLDYHVHQSGQYRFAPTDAPNW